VIAYLARHLTFAFALGVALLMVLTPSSARTVVVDPGSPNEESPEDRGEETFEVARAERETRPQIRRKRTRSLGVVRALPTTVQPSLSVALPLHPSQFSVRRLL
jgi:hypothetical protein